MRLYDIDGISTAEEGILAQTMLARCTGTLRCGCSIDDGEDIVLQFVRRACTEFLEAYEIYNDNRH